MRELHFNLPADANIIQVITEAVVKKVVIDGLSLDDLIYLRAVIQQAINDWHLHITRSLDG